MQRTIDKFQATNLTPSGLGGTFLCIMSVRRFMQLLFPEDGIKIVKQLR